MWIMAEQERWFEGIELPIGFDHGPEKSLASGFLRRTVLI
jgi:hypothetical protein